MRNRAGLAGLRFGYAIADRTIVDFLLAIKQVRLSKRALMKYYFMLRLLLQPYNVSTASEVAVLTALNRFADIKITLDAIIEERARFFDLLSKVQFCMISLIHLHFIRLGHLILILSSSRGSDPSPRKPTLC